MRGILSKRQEPQDWPSYMWRIHKLKERVIGTKPSMDFENAKILTESFLKTEDEPLVLRRHVTEEEKAL